ncbi:hypothetical protein [Acrocarpospora catenulata]|uniref:hypothetical protein n=1 Tax=Acrocarpospora catenulata TaxID=2836182 RepID=UPI003FD86B32
MTGGRPPRIDLDDIVRAGRELGLSGLSVKAVAARLGVTSTALYRYVGGRWDLDRLVGESILAELELRSGSPCCRSPARWALAALAGVPVLLGAFWAAGRVSRTADRAAAEVNSALTERIVEFARTQQALRSARRAEPARSHVGAILAAQHSATVRLLLMQIPGQLLFSIASQLALVLLAGTTTVLAVRGALTIPEAIALIVVIARYLEPFIAVGDAGSALSGGECQRAEVDPSLRAGDRVDDLGVRSVDGPGRAEFEGEVPLVRVEADHLDGVRGGLGELVDVGAGAGPGGAGGDGRDDLGVRQRGDTGDGGDDRDGGLPTARHHVQVGGSAGEVFGQIHGRDDERPDGRGGRVYEGLAVRVELDRVGDVGPGGSRVEDDVDLVEPVHRDQPVSGSKFRPPPSRCGAGIR